MSPYLLDTNVLSKGWKRQPDAKVELDGVISVADSGGGYRGNPGKCGSEPQPGRTGPSQRATRCFPPGTRPLGGLVGCGDLAEPMSQSRCQDLHGNVALVDAGGIIVGCSASRQAFRLAASASVRSARQPARRRQIARAPSGSIPKT